MNQTDLFNFIINFIVGLCTTILTLLMIGSFVFGEYRVGAILILPVFGFWWFLGWLNGIGIRDVIDLMK